MAGWAKIDGTPETSPKPFDFLNRSGWNIPNSPRFRLSQPVRPSNLTVSADLNPFLVGSTKIPR
jgi:hypothetical protein